MGVVRREGQKVYIEGVRKVSWDTGEMCEFASCLGAAMHSLGEEVAYPYLMGTSGAAFRFTYKPDEWDFSDYSIRNIAPDEFEPIRRVFAAIGYSYTLYEPGDFQEDASQIKHSLDRGIPVLAFQVVGPSDCSLITGYDEDGQVLLGWSTYQDIPEDHNIPPDSTGYFRKPGWHENTTGYILLEGKTDLPEPRGQFLDTGFNA